MTKLLWSDWLRIAAFWTLVLAAIVACDYYLEPLDLPSVFRVVWSAIGEVGTASGNDAFAAITEPGFALSLALGLGCLGGSLLLAFAIMDWLLVRLSWTPAKTGSMRAAAA